MEASELRYKDILDAAQAFNRLQENPRSRVATTKAATPTPPLRTGNRVETLLQNSSLQKKPHPHPRDFPNPLASSNAPRFTTWLFWCLTSNDQGGEVMVGPGLTRRLSKLEAAKELEVSPTTVDRMIARGELQTEQEPRGSRYKVWVMIPEDEPGSPGELPGGQSGGDQLSATDTSEVEELISLRLQGNNF